jgi:hypothetical protein
MNWTRRRLLRVGSGVAPSQAIWLPGITGCNSGKPLPKLLQSKVPLPEKFRVDLPRLPVLKASSTEMKIATHSRLSRQAKDTSWTGHNHLGLQWNVSRPDD